MNPTSHTHSGMYNPEGAVLTEFSLHGFCAHPCETNNHSDWPMAILCVFLIRDGYVHCSDPDTTPDPPEYLHVLERVDSVEVPLVPKAGSSSSKVPGSTGSTARRHEVA